jgi:NADH-quinone oxidoreductase subunit G
MSTTAEHTAAATAPKVETVTIEVDGREIKVRKGAMLIEATDQAGIHVPRFCYHNKLSIAANCRMCLVEVERAPKPLPACATPVMPGMKVRTRSPLAREAQKATMEFLLINHPLDCPICDQGGECELQDVAMGYGGDVSRFTEGKRVVPDPDLGPLVQTDLTRCIHCTRCVRFGEEIAGLREMGATGRGEFVRIGTYVAHALTSELSGNIIDICPVGALTAKPSRFQARAWELRQHDGIAGHDAVGSHLEYHLKGKAIIRVVPRASEGVNEVWLSDRDRFAYLGLTAPDRLTTPRIKVDGQWRDAEWNEALAATVDGVKRAISSDSTRLAALASPNATLEELYLLQKVVRGLGSHNIDHRLRQIDFRDDDNDPACPGIGMTIADLERLDAVLLIGAHPRQDQPLLNHRLRKAALAGAEILTVDSLLRAHNFPPHAGTYLAPPSGLVDAVAAIGRAVCEATQRCEGTGWEFLRQAETNSAARAMAERLLAGRRRALFIGNSGRAHPEYATLRALARIIAGAANANLGELTDGANAAGAWLAGAVPHRDAGGRKMGPGRNTLALLNGHHKAYLLLGVEPDLDCLQGAQARAALAAADCVVACTAFASPALEAVAHVLLPIACYPETSGTFINAEGVWQSFAGATAPPGEARPAWKVLRVLGHLAGLAGFEYDTSTAVRDEVAALCRDLETAARPTYGIERGAPLHIHQGPDAQPEAGEIELVVITPAYRSDALTRRAGALQATPHAGDDACHLSPALAQAHGLKDGDLVQLVQGDAGGERSLRCAVRLDAEVPYGIALLHAGREANVAFAPILGAVRLSRLQ